MFLHLVITISLLVILNYVLKPCSYRLAQRRKIYYVLCTTVTILTAASVLKSFFTTETRYFSGPLLHVYMAIFLQIPIIVVPIPISNLFHGWRKLNSSCLTGFQRHPRGDKYQLPYQYPIDSGINSNYGTGYNGDNAPLSFKAKKRRGGDKKKRLAANRRPPKQAYAPSKCDTSSVPNYTLSPPNVPNVLRCPSMGCGAFSRDSNGTTTSSNTCSLPTSTEAAVDSSHTSNFDFNDDVLQINTTPEDHQF